MERLTENTFRHRPNRNVVQFTRRQTRERHFGLGVVSAFFSSPFRLILAREREPSKCKHSVNLCQT
ncbi:unnamed protein product, partial [Nesidiocoris tenuis]